MALYAEKKPRVLYLIHTFQKISQALGHPEKQWLFLAFCRQVLYPLLNAAFLNKTCLFGRPVPNEPSAMIIFWASLYGTSKPSLKPSIPASTKKGNFFSGKVWRSFTKFAKQPAVKDERRTLKNLFWEMSLFGKRVNYSNCIGGMFLMPQAALFESRPTTGSY